MRTLLSLVLLFSLVGLTACDSADDELNDDFSATLTALNGSGVSGEANINIDDDRITVTIDGENLDATAHPQHIHGGGSVSNGVCPTMAADVNGDGFVSVTEGLPSYGGILVPLDDDISNQEQNVDGFPTGTSIDYSESTTMAALMGAIARDDDDDSDPISTIGDGNDIDFDNYVIVVHGTTETLPSTVESLPGLPNQATLPVACGVIENDDEIL